MKGAQVSRTLPWVGEGRGSLFAAHLSWPFLNLSLASLCINSAAATHRTRRSAFARNPDDTMARARWFRVPVSD